MKKATVLALMETFETAKSKYIHRFTMEHIPDWAVRQAPNGKYYAPQYRSDLEWYQNTKFYPAEFTTKNSCYSNNQTWPLGQWLDSPYSL